VPQKQYHGRATGNLTERIGPGTNRLSLLTRRYLLTLQRHRLRSPVARAQPELRPRGRQVLAAPRQFLTSNTRPTSSPTLITNPRHQLQHRHSLLPGVASRTRPNRPAPGTVLPSGRVLTNAHPQILPETHFF
jgi:hypothetical protein